MGVGGRSRCPCGRVAVPQRSSSPTPPWTINSGKLAFLGPSRTPAMIMWATHARTRPPRGRARVRAACAYLAGTPAEGGGPAGRLRFALTSPQAVCARTWGAGQLTLQPILEGQGQDCRRSSVGYRARDEVVANVARVGVPDGPFGRGGRPARPWCNRHNPRPTASRTVRFCLPGRGRRVIPGSSATGSEPAGTATGPAG